MATAPRPGAVDRSGPSKIIRLTQGGETLEFAPDALTLDERVKIRKELGLPFEAFVAGPSAVGEDTLAVWWWLAKRQNGQPNLSWRQFGFDWEGAEGFEVTEVVDDPEDDRPEG